MKRSILIVVLALLLVPGGSVASQGKGNKGQKQAAKAAQKSSKEADKAARKADKENKKSVPVGTSGIHQQLNDNFDEHLQPPLFAWPGALTDAGAP